MSDVQLTDVDLDELAKRWRSKDGGDDVRRLIGALRADRAALAKAQRLMNVAHAEYERGWNDGYESTEGRLSAVIALCDENLLSGRRRVLADHVRAAATGSEPDADPHG